MRLGKSISEFVKNYRRSHRLSQGDLGERLGIHAQYISNIERGVYEGPTVSFVSKIAPHLSKREKKHILKLLDVEMSEHYANLLEKKGVK